MRDEFDFFSCAKYNLFHAFSNNKQKAMKIFSNDEQGAPEMQCLAMRFKRKGEALL